MKKHTSWVIAMNLFWSIIIFSVFILLWACLMTGCANTVIPEIVQPSTIQDDNGFIASVTGGAIITQDALGRYNALVGRYGQDPLFLPPLRANDGIEKQGQYFFIDNQHLTDFALMNSWRKSQTH